VTRYKLIPTRPPGHSYYIEGTETDAYSLAATGFAANGIPVLIVEAPEGGIVRQVCTVPDTKRKVRR
jgi:hypothetical protein